MEDINKYNESEIYKITCNITNKYYIGSTINGRNKRLKQHINNYKMYLNKKYNYCSSYEIIKNNNFKIELIELYNCNNKKELRKREGEIIKKDFFDEYNVNLQIEQRTTKQYYKDNKIKLNNHSKEYYIIHNEKLKNYHTNYNNKNREKINERQKKYYYDNREKINKQNIKEYQIKYRDKHKEKIKERRNNHYEKNKEKTLKQCQIYNLNNKDYKYNLRKYGLTPTKSIKNIYIKRYFEIRNDIKIKYIDKYEKNNKQNKSEYDKERRFFNKYINVIYDFILILNQY